MIIYRVNKSKKWAERVKCSFSGIIAIILKSILNQNIYGVKPSSENYSKNLIELNFFLSKKTLTAKYFKLIKRLFPSNTLEVFVAFPVIILIFNINARRQSIWKPKYSG